MIQAHLQVTYGCCMYHLYEVVLQNKKGDTPFKTGTDKNGTPSGAPPSIFRLLQKIQNVNKDTTSCID